MFRLRSKITVLDVRLLVLNRLCFLFVLANRSWLLLLLLLLSTLCCLTPSRSPPISPPPTSSFAHFSIVPERPSPPKWDDSVVHPFFAPPVHTRDALISYEPRLRSLGAGPEVSARCFLQSPTKTTDGAP